jgi:hypothetical protein
MPSTQRFERAAAGSMVSPHGSRRCVIKCVRKCVIQLHTSTAARPRQHWTFARHPSPTTRPPRGNAEGWVRVVGLGVISVQLLAGAGSQRSADHRLVGVEGWSRQGKEKT